MVKIINMRKESYNDPKFICELCSKKVNMVIREYCTDKWLCLECDSKKSKEHIGKKGNNENV